MKTFSAILTFVQHNRAEVKIKARSLAHARRLADEIQSADVDDWNPLDGEISVESVTEIKTGKRGRK